MILALSLRDLAIASLFCSLDWRTVLAGSRPDPSRLPTVGRGRMLIDVDAPSDRGGPGTSAVCLALLVHFAAVRSGRWIICRAPH